MQGPYTSSPRLQRFVEEQNKVTQFAGSPGQQFLQGLREKASTVGGPAAPRLSQTAQGLGEALGQEAIVPKAPDSAEERVALQPFGKRLTPSRDHKAGAARTPIKAQGKQVPRFADPADSGTLTEKLEARRQALEQEIQRKTTSGDAPPSNTKSYALDYDDDEDIEDGTKEEAKDESLTRMS
jgi:hypothetical protein